MNRCKICHAFAMLDASGRCGSCAKALAATKAGMHYGDYVAAHKQEQTPLPAPDEKTKYCPICGGQIKAVGGHINRKKYCSDSCRNYAGNQAAARRKAAKAAKAALEIGMPQKAESRKPGTCRFCGKEIIRLHMDGRKPSYCDTICQYLASRERIKERANNGQKQP